MKNGKRGLLLMVLCAGAARAQEGVNGTDVVAMDPSITTGTLPSGLRYMVRRNASPKERAELRLVVNAGSTQEDDDQRGMAHFVEHMAFNGTTHFKKNALIGYLQSIGMRFGADVNAQTNYDQTIYELTVPTSGTALDSGLTILTDWASGIQFDSDNVVAERKVILEEWRLRTGPAARIQTAYDTALYRGTPYLDHPPIGTVASITTTNPAPLKRFYTDWYRPDLMAVVAVGDFDQAKMVEAIKQRFGGLRNPTPERPRPHIADSLPHLATVDVVKSPEQHQWSVTTLFPRASAPAGSLEAYRLARVTNLVLSILDLRLGQLVQQPNSPLVSAGLSAGRLQHGEYLYELTLTMKPLQLEAGLTAALGEIDRVARDGVTEMEIEQYRKGFLRMASDAEANTTEQESAALAAQYVTNIIDGSVSLSPAQVVSRLRETVPGIMPADIQAVARTMRDDTAPLMLAAVPAAGADSAAARAISAAMLLGAAAKARTLVLPPYDTRLIDAPLVAYPPAPAKITTTRTIASVGVTEWTLANGVRVLLKPMHDGQGKVFVSGTRWGGVAMADSSDYPSAAMASLVGAGGVGTYDNTALQRKFAGTLAQAATSIGDYAETAGGQSGPRPEDLALLFQLLYLKFTAPRVDSAGVAQWRTQVHDLTQINQQALYLGAFLRDGRSFGRPVIGPTADSVDIGRAMAFYQSRFGNAAGFTFMITGDFTLDAIRPLVQQYLGGLPSTGVVQTAGPRDTGVRPKVGPIRHLLLTEDADPKAKEAIVYTTPLAATQTAAAQVQALASVLQMRLTHRLRQQMGGVYVVQVAGSVDRAPTGMANVQFVYTADPARNEEVRAALLAELDSVRTVGPTATELHDAQQEFKRGHEVGATRADAWVEAMHGFVANGWPLDSLSYNDRVMDAVTIPQMRALAQALFTDAQRIEVTSIPKRFVTAK